MNSNSKIIVCIMLSILCFSSHKVMAQAFRQGSLLISLSEGTSYTTYSTNDGSFHYTDNVTGQRDPITVEYGLTNHWGIGLNMGGDIYNVNPAPYYNFQTANSTVKVKTSELTLDANYHFFTTRHFDLAAFVSLGPSSVFFSGNSDDHSYNYNSCGLLIRTGTKARYYITKRLGVTGMVSTFATQCSSQGGKGNTVGNNYNTTIKGSAIEFGPCYRILR